MRLAIACALLAGCAPHGVHTLPPTVCAVPCPPPDAGPHWAGGCADALGACAAMHEECRAWVLTHYGDD